MHNRKVDRLQKTISGFIPAIQEQESEATAGIGAVEQLNTGKRPVNVSVSELITFYVNVYVSSWPVST